MYIYIYIYIYFTLRTRAAHRRNLTNFLLSLFFVFFFRSVSARWSATASLDRLSLRHRAAAATHMNIPFNRPDSRHVACAR